MTIKDIYNIILYSMMSCHCNNEIIDPAACVWCIRYDMHVLSCKIIMEGGEYH